MFNLVKDRWGRVDFIDLAGQQRRIRENIDSAVGKVLSHGQYIMGPEIRELEEKISAYVGVRHAVGCASGTDALLMALMAYGVGPGDGIFTTPFTFFATAEVISLLGATPIFVDIDPKTYNIDPDKLAQAIKALKNQDDKIHPLPLAARRSPLAVRGVIPVDLFGLPADYDAIDAAARQEGLFVIEDAAQSFGGEYQGRKACSCGDISCTSFFPAKPLGGYGDGGMIFTDNDDLAKSLRSIRVHGQGMDKYENVRIGVNGRLDTLQAAILLAKFAIFPEEVELRQAVAARYSEMLNEGGPAAAGMGDGAERPGEGERSLITPSVPPGYKSVWAQYSVLARDEQARARFLEVLKAAGIPTAIYYPRPLHLQGAFAALGYGPGAFPVSEETARRIFSIPMHPYLLLEDQERICAALRGRKDLD